MKVPLFLLPLFLLPGCDGCGGKPPPAAAPTVALETATRPLPQDGTDAALESFEGKPGEAPPGWRARGGHWVQAEDASAARGPGVLLQEGSARDWAVLLKDGAYAGNLLMTVRFKPVSGTEDASAGLILRAQDAENYYLCRANALEGNFRLYAFRGNRRETLESAEVQPPALGTWHTLGFAIQGDVLTCALDGRTLITHRIDPAKEPAWASGRVGLWTKADSRTAFDDLLVTRLPEPAPKEETP
jgi:hypothetical protein